ncbi:transmembrane amino acid transporter protein-domain-containing protein [Leucosporidium creatinivorum]|uniref:Transmembrane amino acid transporter protein-domain-containing protein n=1 Tax=Leucosporidium creatinivorum TaxID=106004 RepID=A0A1Y2F8L0_9BASI|nr:transmembrane amino acid transporter protein-domain-containing protein [Leucosporidium creatinivorum]
MLLLTEYVVLAILAFPSSFLVLGMAGGVLATLIIGASTYYTSHVLWRYCMKHPEVRDICDAAFALTGKRWAWWAAFVGLALNNWAIMGLHVNAGATAIQTIRGGTECTLVWAVAIAVIMWFFSNLRDFKHMAYIGIIASTTMFICTILTIAGHGAQAHPNGWAEGDPITITVWAPEGTTFVQGMNALLNIVYTWIGHALIPSFVGDLERPEDFPKALAVSMAFEFALFTLTGAIVYHYAGQFSTAPGYGSLISRYGKVAAGFTLPTIIIVGILYSLVTSRAIFFQIFSEGSPHRTRHTMKGWTTWVGIVFAGWVISFIIGEAIPFFNDLLSLISSLFDSWFGYILWAFAYFELYRHNETRSRWAKLEYGFNILILITGAFFFVAGTYASIQSILNSYAAGAIKAPFQCTNTGFTFTA